MPRKKPGAQPTLDLVNARFATACRALVTDGRVPTFLELAASLDLDNANLHRMINGRRNVTLDVLVRLCAIYMINPAYLFPPYTKQMTLKGGKDKLIRIKMIEIEQAKKELQFLQNMSKV